MPITDKIKTRWHLVFANKLISHMYYFFKICKDIIAAFPHYAKVIQTFLEASLFTKIVLMRKLMGKLILFSFVCMNLSIVFCCLHKSCDRQKE